MSYTSIRQDVVTELEIKKSRFITWVSPVSSQSEAEQKISAVTAASLCREIDGFKCRLTDGNRDHAGVA